MAAQHSSWGFQSWSGTAADFHSTDIGFARNVWLCSVETTALILGSSQSHSEIDSAAAHELGIDIVKRRSGGGAVFVAPDQSIWIDITIPRDDPLWVDDVSASMLWVGHAFVRALSQWVSADVYEGVYVPGACGKSVCFSSRSPGEVFVGDHKLVGISQRRTRDGARFQCVLYRHWNVELWLPALIGLTDDETSEIRALPVATIAASGTEVTRALLAALPA